MTQSKSSGNVFQILLSLYFVFTIQAALSQTDTEFWFAAPSVTEGHGDRPIMLRIAAFDQSANVVITQPANPSFRRITVDVGANESYTVGLTDRIDMVESWPANKVLNKGLLIRSNAPIIVYYEVNSDVNPDIFSLKGRNALGKDFFVPAQSQWPNAPWYTPEANSSADIVATEDETMIRITPTVQTRAHQAGEPFTIELDRGQSYSLSTKDSELSSKLTGTTITANKFIAITLKDDSNLFRPCLDLGGDQLVPTDILGTEYIVVKGFLDGGDRVFIQAIEDDTKVSVNGGLADIALEAGEMHNLRLSTEASLIQSNHPVYVLHATGFGCEIGLALLPKLACTGSSKVNFTRSTSENFGIILFTEAGNEDAFTLNGSNDLVPAGAFVNVSGSGGRYVAARLDLTTTPLGTRALTAANSKGSFHLGTINGGFRTGCRYGYFSDYKKLKILTEASNICRGAELLLQATGSDHYEWFGSSAVMGVTDRSVWVLPDTSTTYGVIGSNGTMGCLDTAYLQVGVFEWPEPTIDIGDACLNQPLSLKYIGEESLDLLVWSVNGDTVITAGQEPFQFTPTESRPLEVNLTAINPGGCKVDTIYRIDVAGVGIQLDSAFSVLRGNSIQINTSVTEGDLIGSRISWSPHVGLSCHDCPNPIATPNAETNYTLTVTDSSGCTYHHKIVGYVDAPIYVPNAFTPDHNGRNDRFEVFAEHATIDKILVFDRWGSMVHRMQHPEEGWDGRINGEIAPDGVYIYSISGIHHSSGKPFEIQGTINLIR